MCSGQKMLSGKGWPWDKTVSNFVTQGKKSSALLQGVCPFPFSLANVDKTTQNFSKLACSLHVDVRRLQGLIKVQNTVCTTGQQKQRVCVACSLYPEPLCNWFPHETVLSVIHHPEFLCLCSGAALWGWEQLVGRNWLSQFVSGPCGAQEGVQKETWILWRMLHGPCPCRWGREPCR